MKRRIKENCRRLCFDFYDNIDNKKLRPHMHTGIFDTVIIALTVPAASIILPNPAIPIEAIAAVVVAVSAHLMDEYSAVEVVVVAVVATPPYPDRLPS